MSLEDLVVSLTISQRHCGELSVGKHDRLRSMMISVKLLSSEFLPRLGWKLKGPNCPYQLSRTEITKPNIWFCNFQNFP